MMTDVRTFLAQIADRLDEMVEANLSGGWSTNNNAQMTALADACRRKAAQLRPTGGTKESVG